MSNFGILLGHRWCSSCLKKHKNDPLCGECRQPKGKPHRIYLDLEDLVDEQIALVADGLDAINTDSSLSAIENLNRTVIKLHQKPNTDPAVSVSSLRSPKHNRTMIETPSLRKYSLKQSRTSKNEWLLQLSDLQGLKI